MLGYEMEEVVEFTVGTSQTQLAETDVAVEIICGQGNFGSLVVTLYAPSNTTAADLEAARLSLAQGVQNNVYDLHGFNSTIFTTHNATTVILNERMLAILGLTTATTVVAGTPNPAPTEASAAVDLELIVAVIVAGVLICVLLGMIVVVKLRGGRAPGDFTVQDTTGKARMVAGLDLWRKNSVKTASQLESDQDFTNFAFKLTDRDAGASLQPTSPNASGVAHMYATSDDYIQLADGANASADYIQLANGGTPYAQPQPAPRAARTCPLTRSAPCQ